MSRLSLFRRAPFTFDRAPKRIHQVDHARGRRARRLFLWRQPGLLLLQHIDNGELVTVLELGRIEMPSLDLENVFREFDHFSAESYLYFAKMSSIIFWATSFCDAKNR
jgi:hypothetical protein